MMIAGRTHAVMLLLKYQLHAKVQVAMYLILVLAQIFICSRQSLYYSVLLAREGLVDLGQDLRCVMNAQ